ncbi:substrate-binding periplasmic protein [Shewanella salipaludis]|uniref:Transporter substrate-binding domain-containing protein n=1 Tax=Shewanella salipaludis TaxID=2723052 RepID=A0A972JMC3_9GAMM|nr:transporter substrate-binding domain-containing protein [Shewanella salipaludis]NMH64956.1 transporter substrate-binding domain-containing protein [Shewanella salipaludis]
MPLRQILNIAFFCITLLAFNAPLRAEPVPPGPLESHAPETYKLHIVFHEFAPFSFVDDQGKATGALVEIAQRVCQDWPDKCEISLRPNRRAKQLFFTGEMQATFLGWSQERASSMWFSLPMVETEYGFYSLKNNPFIPEQATADTVVGVFSPSNTHGSLQKIERQRQQQGMARLRVELYPQANEAPLRMLQKGRFDAYYVNKDVGAYYAKRLGLTALDYTPGETHVRYCLAFEMHHTPFESVKAFNRLFQELLSQGRLDAIYRKWHMTPALLDPIMYPELNMPF